MPVALFPESLQVIPSLFLFGESYLHAYVFMVRELKKTFPVVLEGFQRRIHCSVICVYWNNISVN